MKVDGGCHCGAIKFEADIDPEKVMICHCTDCQALSGSAFRTVVPVPRDTPAYSLRVGSIRQRAELKPKGQAWCRSALGWLPDLGGRKYERSKT